MAKKGKMMAEKSIYDLKLHEKSIIAENDEKDAGISAMRVPGGWIYTLIVDKVMSQIFVPFDYEFMPKAKDPELDALVDVAFTQEPPEPGCEKLSNDENASPSDSESH